MLKSLLAFILAIPACAVSQSYANSPFYTRVSAIPASAFIEGWSHGSIKANGVVIDLSQVVPWSSPDVDEIRGWRLNSWVDRNTPDHTFHFLIEYDHLNLKFGYNLFVEPIANSDKIRCTFSVLTDPDELSESAWHRDSFVPLVALPPDLTPVVVKSGDLLSITTLPLGPGKLAVDHYIRLTRLDLASVAAR